MHLQEPPINQIASEGVLTVAVVEQTRTERPMTSTRLFHRCLVVSVSIVLALSACENGPTDADSAVDRALNGAWVNGVQSGSIKVYITELRFNSGSFEWTWDGDLQQRGVYDTRDGILTVTIHNNYGSPLRLLGDYSRSYSITGDTLTWGGSQYTRM